MQYLTPQIKLFITVTLLFIALVTSFYIIADSYRHWQFLRSQQINLQIQWQDQYHQQARIQQIQADAILLNQRYKSQLEFLKESKSLAIILNQLTLLTKAHRLQLNSLKPVHSQPMAELQQETIRIDINGKEKMLFDFLQVLMKQRWLCGIEQFQFNSVANGMRLQAILDIYHGARNSRSA